MDGIEEDEGYSDDDLDALPIHTFQELQQDAIRSTQQPLPPQHFQLPSVKQPAGINGGLGGFDRLSLGQYGSDTQQLPSSDYGDFDDEMLDGEIFDTAAERPALLANHPNAHQSAGESMQNEAWRHEAHADSSPKTARHPQQQPVNRLSPTGLTGLGQSVRRADSGRAIVLDEIPEADPPAVTLADNTAVLQAKLDELARENEKLKQDYNAAKSDAFSKTGEIAIVRANRLKEKQEEERRLEQERKSRAEEQAKYNAELQKYKAELQKISTDKAFIENDLARETEQRKGYQRNTKATGKLGDTKALGKENIATTPKKSKVASLGDGFNDEEIQVQSQSSLAVRSKPVTPKAGVKRKRKPTENSPVKPLQLSQARKDSRGGESSKGAEDQALEAPAEASVNEGQKNIVQVAQADDDQFKVRKFCPVKPFILFNWQTQFIQKVLNHRLEPGAKRTIEALADFSLPSNPHQALSTLFYDGLSGLSIKMDIDSFPAALGLIVVDLWSQCLDADLVGFRFLFKTYH